MQKGRSVSMKNGEYFASYVPIVSFNKITMLFAAVVLMRFAVLEKN